MPVPPLTRIEKFYSIFPGKARINAKTAYIRFSRLSAVQNIRYPLGKHEGARRLHQKSAGGGVYGAEERLKAASHINFRP